MNRSKHRKSTVKPHISLESKSTAHLATNRVVHSDKQYSIGVHDSDVAVRVLFGVIAVSLLSIPICYMLSYLQQMKNASNVFFYSVIICVSIAPLTYALLIKHLLYIKKEVYFYVFTIFAFTAVADLLLALTIDQYSTAFHFYLEQGEVYLQTAHGLFINYWDGTTHYVLYLLMLYCMLKQQTQTKFYRFLSLFWCGSILNSLLVLMGGAAIGRYGTHIKPSYLLNVPYAMFPLMFVVRQFNLRNNFIEQRMKQNRLKRCANSLIARPLDSIFIIYLLFAIVFSIYRVLHVLQTPIMNQSIYYNYEPYMLNTSGFPMIQLIMYAMYFVPYYCAAIRSFLFYDQQPSQFRWFPDWTMLHAGAAAQAQFSYFSASLYNPSLFPDSSWSTIPTEHRPLTITLNSILAIVPQVMAWRVCSGNRDVDFY
jgi:hypothetical protein